MNGARSSLSAIVLLLVWPLFTHAQQKQLSPNARKLADALTELQKKPDDPEVQERYLDAFPHDYKAFLSLFDLGRELSDGHDYIRILPSLAKHHELEVGQLLVQLSKDAHYEADAPSYLQRATAQYANRHTESFVKLVHQLSPRKRSRLVTFLADVENHGAYPEYQGIIDHLNALGQKHLAKEFEAAREKRSRQPHG